MYTIRFPDDKPFTGEYLSVTFKEGEGQTDSDYLAERFARKGMGVSRDPESEQITGEPSEDEKAEAAAEKEQKKAAAAAKKAAAQSAGEPDAKDGE